MPKSGIYPTPAAKGLIRGTSKSKWTDQIQIQMSQIPAAGKSNQIKWSPREKKSKSNPNQIPAQKTQMGPNGGAREPAIWDLSFCLTTIDAANRSSSTLLSPTHDSGAIRSNILLARLMRRMSVCEFGFVVPCVLLKPSSSFVQGMSTFLWVR